MRRNVLIFGFGLIVLGLLISAIPSQTPYQRSYQEVVPEYGYYFVGFIETSTSTFQIVGPHRIVNYEIEREGNFWKLTIWNEYGQSLAFDEVTNYKLDWQRVEVGSKYETRYETIYVTEYPYRQWGFILALIGIPMAIYGAISKPISVEYKPSSPKPLLCPYCQAVLSEEGIYCIRCGRKIS